MSNFNFEIIKKSKKGLGRVGVFHTPHGAITTPAFVAVGTKGTVKALTPEEIREANIQIVLANTYHLYLQPGEKIIKKAGGIHKFMNWHGPIMTDSGGFQAFSLGAGFDRKINKLVANRENERKKKRGDLSEITKGTKKMAKVTEDGVEFSSPYDGKKHFFTPEKSIQIQYDIGADIIFAFDECPPSDSNKEYQIKAMERTHRWALRSIKEHEKLDKNEKQAIFGIVQGGNFKDLRKKSARIISEMSFDGFGIGGTFKKEDIGKVVAEVNKILPEEKPRHLLGIGEVEDVIEAIKAGCDLFDCVAPTRMARNGTLHTSLGKINIENSAFKNDFSPIEKGCGCYTCQNYTRAYLRHLFHAKEMLAGTLASIHNIYFLENVIRKEREGIIS